MSSLRERLEAVKVGARGPETSATSVPIGFSFGGAGSRIAKPLRGGGAVENGSGSNVPVISSLQAQVTNEKGGKRGSWFFDRGR